MKRSLHVALVAATLASLSPASAGDWQKDLTAQMLIEHECEVDFYSNVVEREQDGRLVVFVRVHCHDQRLYDATRFAENELFEVRACKEGQVQSC